MSWSITWGFPTKMDCMCRLKQSPAFLSQRLSPKVFSRHCRTRPPRTGATLSNTRSSKTLEISSEEMSYRGKRTSSTSTSGLEAATLSTSMSELKATLSGVVMVCSPWGSKMFFETFVTVWTRWQKKWPFLARKTVRNVLQTVENCEIACR